jgi:hypothetical protein
MLEVGSKPLDTFVVAPVEKPGFFRPAEAYVRVLPKELR